MVGTRTALNTVQKLPTFAVVGSATTQDFAMYTCPAGRKAILNAVLLLDTYGSSSQINIKVGGTSIMRFIFGTDAVNANKNLQGVSLSAGQIFEKDDNGSGNSNVRFDLTVQESDA